MKKGFYRDLRLPVSFTLNRDEYKALEALAKAANINASAMVRKLIAEATEAQEAE